MLHRRTTCEMKELCWSAITDFEPILADHPTLPLSPQRGAQKRKTAVFGVKSHFAWRKSATEYGVSSASTSSFHHPMFWQLPSEHYQTSLLWVCGTVKALTNVTTVSKSFAESSPQHLNGVSPSRMHMHFRAKIT